MKSLISNKKINSFRYIRLLVLMLSLTIMGSSVALSIPKLDLKSNENFVILAGSTVTGIPPVSIEGNVGLSPAAGSMIVGFDGSNVDGILYVVDATGPAGSVQDAVLLQTAKSDLTTAYNDAAGRTPVPTGDFLNPGSGNIGGLNLVAGLYKFTSSAAITGLDVTLTGSNTDVWIFQIASSLNVGSGIKVILAGGAQAANIFWQVGTSATLGTYSTFKGTILADQSISFGTGATIDGRALAFTGAVTMSSGVTPKLSVAEFPIFTADSSEVQFGNVALNSQKMDSVEVENTGNDDLIIDNVTSSNNMYSVTPNGVTLAPGETKMFYITFLPTLNGYESGYIYFTHNAENIIDSILVNGTGGNGFSIPLEIGWNMISSYVTPNDSDMDSVFKKIKNNILIVKNGLGKLYVPSYNINTIGNWNIHHGYQVYSTSVDTLIINGVATIPETNFIFTNTGWNMLGYLRNSPMASPTALASLTEFDKLLIAKNGKGKLFVPSYNINTIGNMKPGDGYQMYITGIDTLIYPANGSSKVIFTDEILKNVNLKTEFEATGSDMTLIIEANYEDATEIGVYNTDGMLIGSGIFQNGKAGITIWGDDEYTEVKVGAEYSEVLSVKVLENGNLTEKEVEYSDGSELTFEKGGFVVGKINAATENNTIKLTPNPATDKLSIELPNEDIKSIEIRDMKGKLVLELNNDQLSNEINISNLTNGTYFITIINENGTYTEKFVKVK